MKKHNVIDLAAYREKLDRTTDDIKLPVSTISPELKSAIETLIDKLRDASPDKKIS